METHVQGAHRSLQSEQSNTGELEWLAKESFCSGHFEVEVKARPLLAQAPEPINSGPLALTPGYR